MSRYVAMIRVQTELKIDEVLVVTRVPDCDLSNRTKENTVMRFGQTKTMTMVDKLWLSNKLRNHYQNQYIINYQISFTTNHYIVLFLRKSRV